MSSSPVKQLRPCRICQGLSNAQIERVADACTWRDLEPEELLTWPGDSVYALYVVTRGRLRMYLGEENGRERFLGYVNQGDTTGQTSLISSEIDDRRRLVADITSRVAVLNRPRALRMVFEIPRFRENLIAGLGLNLDRIFRGENLKRIPRIVGVVAAANPGRQFLTSLIRELQKRGETICVFTSRPGEFAAASSTASLPTDDVVDVPALRGEIGSHLANATRVLIDIVTPASEDALIKGVQECDEILWCCDNASPDRAGESTLANLVDRYPAWRSRMVRVQIQSPGQLVGRPDVCGPTLVHRDLMVPLNHSRKPADRRHQQGMDRIVRHLRGVKIGLALGGGGARGLSHLGVLRVLDREGISFDLMSGTSAGAMIGLGYAAGMSTEFLIEAFPEALQPPGWMNRIPGGRRLYLFGKYRSRAWDRMLRDYYFDWTFEQLPIPFFAVVTDLVAANQVVRESGDVVQAILESINVPVLSEPILRDGQVLVDGGVVNNLPAALLSERGAEFVLGVDASKEIPAHFAGNRSTTPLRQMKKPGRLETAYRVMEVSRRGIAELQMNQADLVIEPDTSAFDFADFTAARQIAEAGQAAAEKMMPQIRAAYDQLMND